MAVLVTGSAGFIGFHTARALLDRGDTVVGVDSMDPYYDPALKRARHDILDGLAGFSRHEISVADRPALEAVFAEVKPKRVIHLAAQAGVRYSVENPHAYVDANLVGFTNILECCRHGAVEHLVFASTSSVYGANALMPFEEHHGAGHPMSFYAATKRANELMAHAYAHLYGFPCTGLRFFTVYGPWGRPDMALFRFTEAILAGRPIQVFNNGDMERDFTYVDDIVDAVVAVSDRPPDADPAWDAASPHPATGRSGVAPYRIYNIGRGQPVQLMDFIRVLEDKLGAKAELEMLPMQAGDVAATRASIDALTALTGVAPSVSVEEGVGHFVAWYRDYYGV